MPGVFDPGGAVDQFMGPVLQLLGAPASPDNLRFLRDFSRSEGTGLDLNNPLDTTLPFGSSWVDFNSTGVKQYPDVATGERATAATLGLSYYGPLVSGLKQSAPLAYYLQPDPVAAMRTWQGGSDAAVNAIKADLGGRDPGGDVATTPHLGLGLGPVSGFQQAAYLGQGVSQNAGIFAQRNLVALAVTAIVLLVLFVL